MTLRGAEPQHCHHGQSLLSTAVSSAGSAGRVLVLTELLGVEREHVGNEAGEGSGTAPGERLPVSVLMLSIGMNWLEGSFPGLINPFSHLFSVRPSQETVFSTIKHPVSSKWSRACREGHEDGAASGSHMLSSEVCFTAPSAKPDGCLFLPPDSPASERCVCPVQLVWEFMGLIG